MVVINHVITRRKASYPDDKKKISQQAFGANSTFNRSFAVAVDVSHSQKDFFRGICPVNFRLLVNLRETRSIFIRIRVIYFSDLGCRDSIEDSIDVRIDVLHKISSGILSNSPISSLRVILAPQSPSNPRSTPRAVQPIASPRKVTSSRRYFMR